MCHNYAQYQSVRVSCYYIYLYIIIYVSHLKKGMKVLLLLEEKLV